MHMGAMAVMGAQCPRGVVHMVINNGAHETVGGMPTVAGRADLCGVARACGYPTVLKADSYEELNAALDKAKAADTLVFLEVSAQIGAREDLGRPTTTAMQNKQAFMAELAKL